MQTQTQIGHQEMANKVILANSGSMASAKFQNEMTELFAKCLALADLYGRLHVLELAEAKTGNKISMARTASFSDMSSTALAFRNVPFQEAIKRLENMTGFTKTAFDGLSQKYKLQAFTISGVSDVALIDKIKNELVKSAKTGTTSADFKNVVEQLTSEAKITSLADAQVNTVFQTNILKAYSHGKYEQQTDPDVADALPYWQYCTAGDERVRPAHAALNGFTAKNDDMVWGRLYPPCGYNCRCTVVALLPSEATPEADLPGLGRIPLMAIGVPDPGFGGFLQMGS